ncbi:MAG: hypothetical protein ACLGHJ_01430 [Gammaproteobacteria bacterium]
MQPRLGKHCPAGARLSAALALAVLCLWLGLAAPAAATLAALADEDMAAVNGAGIAIALDDFQFAMAPTSYFEQVGNNPPVLCSGSGPVASNLNCWRRGDLRWYGVNMSGASGAAGPYQWNDATSCDPTSLNCPRGGVVDQFSPFDNPYLIRAWSPEGLIYEIGIVPDPNNPPDVMVDVRTLYTNAKSIYEFLAPTQQPYYTFSFWGEIEAGSTRASASQALATNAGSILKSQTIIRGNAAGSIFRMFQMPPTTVGGSHTLGMFYHSRLRGDFRFSVAQTGTTSDAIGTPVVFANNEGVHFRNVEAFIPVGQLFYQAITLGPVGTSGNYYIDVTS